MDGAFILKGREDKCIQHFSSEMCREDTIWETWS